MENFYTPDEIAKALKVSKQSVLRWIKSGKLEAKQVSERSYRVRESDFVSFCEGKTDYETAETASV